MCSVLSAPPLPKYHRNTVHLPHFSHCSFSVLLFALYICRCNHCVSVQADKKVNLMQRQKASFLKKAWGCKRKTERVDTEKTQRHNAGLSSILPLYVHLSAYTVWWAQMLWLVFQRSTFPWCVLSFQALIRLMEESALPTTSTKANSVSL